MRKITTKKDQVRKTRKNQLIIGIVLIGLMVFSTVGYALVGNETDSSNSIDYKGVEFVEDSGYWFFSVQGIDFSTIYNPLELEDIVPVVYSTFNSYSNKPLYFVGEGDAVYEIARNLNPFVLRIQSSCLSNEDCLGDFPIKDCSLDNVIIIREPLENENEFVYQEENCVFIVSNSENQAEYADAFLFKILGI